MHHEHEAIGLRTLEDISGLILHSHDLQETLDNIVNLVARRMKSDVCSIYLLEHDGETLTLQASKGLAKSAIGKITMKISEGLTGLVVEQRGVVNIENAPAHPRYKYFKETGEEKFTSFLGVPLFERKTPVGVIVVQTKEARSFTQHEISTIATIAYQISSIVINAKLLDSVRSKEEERAFFERELARAQQEAVGKERQPAKNGKEQRRSMTGSSASPGFCWGKLYILDHQGERKGTRTAIKVLSRGEEKKRFLVALEKAKIQTLYMEKRVAATLSKEDAAIFHSHLMIMEDRGVTARIIEAIDSDCGAVAAVESVIDHYVTAFSNMEDPYLRQRSADMLDIGRRIIDCLEGKESRTRLRDKKIIVADDILPSDMATLNTDKVLGIITEKGDVNSHAAIMARSLGIPAVLGIEGLLKTVRPRDEVIIDGTSGHIYINPDAGIKTEYERLQRDHSQRQRELEGMRDLPAITTDGCRMNLRANIGLLSDIKVALANGAAGVGLYRTEFPYMARKSFPNRGEQFEIYKKILEGFSGFPVNIRTLDIGGDKGLPYFDYPKEDNPFMGWRSIRVSLDRQDIFRDQLAAVLMASVHGQASLMFPMVSGIDEIRQIKEIIGEVCLELHRAGIPYSQEMQLGIMIELPAAVQTAHILIHEVDYFSIGTNDLIQYTMAADRNNPKVKRYYDPFHPAVLHAIKRVVDVATAEEKPVSICGEMASIPIAAVLLLGMGITDFSLSAPAIPVIKQVIRKVSLETAREVAAHALSLESASSIHSYLEIITSELGL
ncbi:phosphoenolpyruvate--protein phosphotransferase [Geobacter pelophilus]|uniref:phosphoenolpyruvate--protein phosphotransferase n=1 Tax=Geoanaerobacter pelophilus TaxID=60036 RepID=A0AAW4L2G6_9BACT|nr:phosphoenolpyruvate--protein phosphotransferase [Geoanaerobacter pelophilus]MBT0662830.1 phosphoenolpyruvate--protein phosphotransferase [Geoanaerobacter pelophilus]